MAGSKGIFARWKKVSCRRPAGTIVLLMALTTGVPGIAAPSQARPVAAAVAPAVLDCPPQAASPQPPTTQQRIMMIVIRGNRRVESSKLRALISSRVEEKYDSAKIERDVAALKNTGYFDEVRAVASDDVIRKNEKVVTFLVREKKDLVIPNPR